MKVSYRWLKDFVEIKTAPKALAEKLTMAGLEVTSLEEKDGDFVFEMEITANRPDCLSVIGIAREVAAITGKKLASWPVGQFASLNRQTGRPADRLTINIQDKTDCPLYTAKIIKDVKVGPSPAWLKKRLELVGCRSVNNIVDITNYVLFEWGEPLHAFDLDKLVSPSARQPVSPLKINIRRAKKGEGITTIDGINRMLEENILIIASGVDKETGRPADRQTGKPIAIAGIMGGKDTEVTASTQNLLLEAAIFNPIMIRRVRQKLGLQTDSSYRFERGIDLETAEFASWRATQLIQEIAQGKCVLAQSSGPLKTKKKEVNLDISFVAKILGVNISTPKIKKILNDLGFKTKAKSKNNFRVAIPAHRQDVNSEIDLIEEIARIFGYENIPKSLPAVKPQLTLCQRRGLVSLIKNILAGLGLNEAITYSLMDKDLLRILEQPNTKPIEILNPLSKEQEILRPRLIAGLLRGIAYNLNQKQDYINIFEIANIFSGTANAPKEELTLGIALCGTKSCLLFGQGMIKDTLGPLHLKGILETLFAQLGIKDYGFTMMADNQIAIGLGQETTGVILGLSADILDNLTIKNKDVWVTELSLDKLLTYVNLKKRFVPLPIYPGVSRDISLILKDDILIEDVLKEIKQKGRPLLKEAKIVDYYKGKPIPAGSKGLTISCLYRLDERTLTEAEINPIHSLVSKLLVDKFAAQIR